MNKVLKKLLKNKVFDVTGKKDSNQGLWKFATTLHAIQNLDELLPSKIHTKLINNEFQYGKKVLFYGQNNK